MSGESREIKAYVIDMRKLLFAIGLIFAAGIPILCQDSPYFTVSNIRNGADYSFPMLESRRNLDVETRINQFLQLSELRALVGRNRRSAFDQVAINDGSIYGGKVSLSYRLHANSSRIFSLDVFSSLDGATTHWWNRYYNFNPRNGDQMILSDLFTVEGYEKFKAVVIKRRAQEFRKKVIKKVAKDDRDSYYGVIGSIEQDDLSDFFIKGSSITIDGYNLLGKSFCCDGVGMEVRFPLSTFAPYLNKWGRIIFGLSNGDTEKFRSASLPQLFTGAVDGRSKFVAVLFSDTGKFDSGGVEGIYAYLKYRKGIYLTGTLDGERLELTEHVLTKTTLNPKTDVDHEFVDNGSIVGTFDGKTLTGVWADKNKTQSFPIFAKRN